MSNNNNSAVDQEKVNREIQIRVSAALDVRKSYSALFFMLDYRQTLANDILSTDQNSPNFEVLNQMYDKCNGDLKKYLGI